jgi:hypothetical protein
MYFSVPAGGTVAVESAGTAKTVTPIFATSSCTLSTSDVKVLEGVSSHPEIPNDRAESLFDAPRVDRGSIIFAKFGTALARPYRLQLPNLTSSLEEGLLSLNSPSIALIALESKICEENELGCIDCDISAPKFSTDITPRSLNQ